jgi:peptidoglycan hydrolase-like protein with peptidoglycan-binding domain
MRKWLLAGLGVVVVLAVAGTTAYALLFRPAAPPAAQPAPPQTATITRTDLSTSVVLNGSLGYGPATTFTGHRAGTVTWLPAVGTVVGRGQRLYSVDATPVELFLGSTPLYRTIDATTAPGPDITEINANLRDLGYRAAPSGSGYTAGTAEAIKQWQRHNGFDQTGTLAVGDVAMLPAPVRVDSLKVQPGAPAAADLLGLTSTTKLVTAAVDPTQVDTSLLTPGSKVALTLPENTATTGTVAALSSAPAAADPPDPSSPSAGGGPGGQTLTITIDDQSSVSDVDSGSVGVTVVTGSRKGVLAVPVGALVAVQGGGYAVQAVTGRTTLLVRVQTGMFANGLVEVSGQGVIAGLKVVTVS